MEKKRLTELGELGRGKSKHRPRNDPRLYGGLYPFIQTGDIAKAGEWIKGHSQTYSEFGLAQSRLWPAGTLCITIAANIADTALLSYAACFPDSVVGFVANGQACYPQFIKWSLDVIKADLEAFAPATAQKNINLAVLYEIELNCPSLPEQAEIVRRVEELFALADRIEVGLREACTQIDRLTPAVLAKAFRGELVSQDASDESASLLLEKVRTEHAALAKGRRKSRAKPTMSQIPNIPIADLISDRFSNKWFSFADLRTAAGTRSYDELKAAVFELLRQSGGSEAHLTSRFNDETELMEFSLLKS